MKLKSLIIVLLVIIFILSCFIFKSEITTQKHMWGEENRIELNKDDRIDVIKISTVSTTGSFETHKLIYSIEINERMYKFEGLSGEFASQYYEIADINGDGIKEIMIKISNYTGKKTTNYWKIYNYNNEDELNYIKDVECGDVTYNNILRHIKITKLNDDGIMSKKYYLFW